jgi:hypothetical protein
MAYGVNGEFGVGENSVLEGEYPSIEPQEVQGCWTLGVTLKRAVSTRDTHQTLNVMSD